MSSRAASISQASWCPGCAVPAMGTAFRQTAPERPLLLEERHTGVAEQPVQLRLARRVASSSARLVGAQQQGPTGREHTRRRVAARCAGAGVLQTDVFSVSLYLLLRAPTPGAR